MASDAQDRAQLVLESARPHEGLVQRAARGQVVGGLAESGDRHRGLRQIAEEIDVLGEQLGFPVDGAAALVRFSARIGAVIMPVTGSVTRHTAASYGMSRRSCVEASANMLRASVAFADRESSSARPTEMREIIELVIP